MRNRYSIAAMLLLSCCVFHDGRCAVPEGPVVEGDVLRWWPRNAEGVVVIPKQVRHVAAGAFCDCSGVTRIVFPQKVESIGDFAFARCYGLTEVEVPGSVTNIGADAFFCCVNLTNAVVDAMVGDIPRGMFKRCWRLECVKLPEGLCSIGEQAFSECRSMLNVTIPSGVTNISAHAFASCACLERVEIPDGLKSLGDRAFGWCYRLREVRVPAGVVVMGNDVFFDNASADREVGIPGLAGIVRLAADGISQEGSTFGVDLLSMDHFAAHANEVRIGMSHGDVQQVLRRSNYRFFHVATNDGNGNVVNKSTCIKFGQSKNGDVSLILEYNNDKVYRIVLTDALKSGARAGIQKSKVEVCKAVLGWL